MFNVLDDQVGEIVATVERLDLTGSTLIVFTSDNGPAAEGGAHPTFFNSSRGLREQERDFYVGGIRLPLIARWPATVRELERLRQGARTASPLFSLCQQGYLQGKSSHRWLTSHYARCRVEEKR